MDGSTDEVVIISIAEQRRPAIVIAGLASAILPGSGQVLLSQRRLGVVLFTLFLIPVACMTALRIGATYGGYLFGGLSILLLCVSSSTLIFVIPVAKARSWGWYALVLPIALIATTLWDTGLLRVSGLQAFRLASSSMERTIFANDSIVFDMQAYSKQKPTRGDVVTFRHKGIFLVKRLVAISGDRVSSRDGVVSVNGHALFEPYANHNRDLETRFDSFDEVMVPDGEVFLMGDNRNASLDSRMEEFGKVLSTDIVGKVIFVVRSSHDETGRELH